MALRIFSGLVLLLMSLLVQRSCSEEGEDSAVVLSLSPMPLSEDRDLEYSVPHNENFTVTCTAMSHDPNVFVLWRRTDGRISSLIADNGTILFNKARGSESGDAQAPHGVSGSGSGSTANNGSSSEQDTSGESGTNDEFSGDSSGSASGGSVNASGDGSGGTVKLEYTASALLQVSVEDGKGIQCSDVGQYECIAGISHQSGDIVNVTVSLAKEGTCCKEEITVGSKTFTWQEVSRNTRIYHLCPNNIKYSVSRLCNSQGKWGDFDRNGCGVLDDQLDNIISSITNSTNETVGEHLTTLNNFIEQSLNNEVDQHENNLNTIANVLPNITDQINQSDRSNFVSNVVNIVDSLLQWTAAVIEADSGSRIMQTFEDFFSQYAQDIPENTNRTHNSTSLNIVAERVNLDDLKTNGRKFSAIDGKLVTERINSLQEGTGIELPASLFQRFGDQFNSVGIFFGLYETATLFPTGGTSSDSESRTTEIYSQVLAATVGHNLIIQNLESPVIISFKPQNPEGKYIDPSSKRCVSWNFSTQSWTPHGCNITDDTDEIIQCECNHLTNFAVLVETCSREADCVTLNVAEELNQLNDTFFNLTAENVEGAVQSLSVDIAETENNEAEQNDEVLGSVADYFTELKNFLTQPNTTITTTVVNNVANVVSSLLQWNPENVVVESSSKVVQSFEVILSTSAQQAPLNEVQKFTVPSLTILTERRDVTNLTKEGRSFSIGADINDTMLGSENQVRPGELSSQQNAAIILPGSLFARIINQPTVGAVFGVYESTNLFPVAGIDYNDSIVTEVGTHILSATVGNTTIHLDDLSEPVTVTLRLNVNDSVFVIPGSERCVAWDFELQDWTPRGCTTKISHDREFATCTCSHLTNFCTLVDICLREDNCEESKVERALTYISYIGMPISIASLVLTLISLIIFKNVRQKDITKLHIQLCLALLLMLIISLAFVVLSAESVPALYGGCVFVSLLVHYFALTSVLWMGAEALLMFQKLVIVFVQTTTKYIIILSIVCWSAPAVPVIITLISELANGNEVEDDIMTKRDESGTLIFCFLSHPGAFWGAFLAPLLAIFLFNIVILVCVIAVLIKHVKKTANLKNQPVSRNDAIRVIFSIGGVMSLFGLTWLFAVLTFSVTGLREAFQVLFTIFNSFQGLFIFLFLCVMSSDVREEWKAFFTIKPQMTTPQKQKFDKKPNPNYTATTGTVETSCKSPSSTHPSTSESIPWKEKLGVGKERASVCINMPFDDVCDDVFEDDEKKESDEPKKQSPQPEPEKETMEEKAVDEESAEGEPNKPISQPESKEEADNDKNTGEEEEKSELDQQPKPELEKEAMEEKEKSNDSA